MTCIVGLEHSGKVWLAGDSATCRGDLIQLDRTPKVVKRGEFLIGGCGGSRLADLMRFVFTPPRIPAKTGLEAYMVRRFAVEMKKCFEKHGYGKEANEDGELYDGMVMVGVRGRLFEIDAAFSVTRSRDGFGALGSGAEVALGVLHVTDHLKPRERLVRALEVSAKVYTTVAPPFEIVSA